MLSCIEPDVAQLYRSRCCPAVSKPIWFDLVTPGSISFQLARYPFTLFFLFHSLPFCSILVPFRSIRFLAKRRPSKQLQLAPTERASKFAKRNDFGSPSSAVVGFICTSFYRSGDPDAVAASGPKRVISEANIGLMSATSSSWSRLCFERSVFNE